MHPLVQLARDTVEQFTRQRTVKTPPASLSEEMKDQAGVFVSIKKKGALRGCIGTFSPTTANIAYEIIQNAISAATKDPRFSPVEVSELGDLEYSVDILTKPEQIADRRELDPKKFGVIVQSGNRRGLLLPDLEGVDTVDEQVNIAMMKAGIYPEDDIDLYRFEVKRYR